MDVSKGILASLLQSIVTTTVTKNGRREQGLSNCKKNYQNNKPEYYKPQLAALYLLAWIFGFGSCLIHDCFLVSFQERRSKLKTLSPFDDSLLQTFSSMPLRFVYRLLKIESWRRYFQATERFTEQRVNWTPCTFFPLCKDCKRNQ